MTANEPMPSTIKLPWVVKLFGAPEALIGLARFEADNEAKTKASASLSPTDDQGEKAMLSALYSTYVIADRCTGLNASFNKEQVTAMMASVKSRIEEMHISCEDNDNTWRAVQSQATAMTLRLKDCVDTRKQISISISASSLYGGRKAKSILSTDCLVISCPARQQLLSGPFLKAQ